MCERIIGAQYGKIYEILIIFMWSSKILQWRSPRKYTRQYALFLSKLSSILVIKVEVYRSRSEDARRRREKEMASGIHHNAVTKASADDTF